MEETKNATTPPGSKGPNGGRIIDLTPSMEARNRARIIELTRVLKPSTAKQSSGPASRTAGEKPAAGNPSPPKSKDGPGIDTIVGAAFDAIASPIDSQPLPAKKSDDAIMTLSRIAEPEASAAPSTVEPELELTIDELSEDEKVPKEACREINDSVDAAFAEDADLLDLTDLIGPEDSASDDAIELTEIVDSPIAAAEKDDTVDLTDTTDLLALDADDDDPIVLTDVVDPPAEALDDDEPILLTDIVDMQSLELDDEESAIEDDDTIELTDIVLEPQVDEETMSKVIEKAFSDYALKSARRLAGSDNGTVADDGRMQDAAPALTEPPSPVEIKIEKALEKILQTKYAQTIEAAIARAVESVVVREIEKIKNNLIEDED